MTSNKLVTLNFNVPYLLNSSQVSREHARGRAYGLAISCSSRFPGIADTSLVLQTKTSVYPFTFTTASLPSPTAQAKGRKQGSLTNKSPYIRQDNLNT